MSIETSMQNLNLNEIVPESVFYKYIDVFKVTVQFTGQQKC